MSLEKLDAQWCPFHAHVTAQRPMRAYGTLNSFEGDGAPIGHRPGTFFDAGCKNHGETCRKHGGKWVKVPSNHPKNGVNSPKLRENWRKHNMDHVLLFYSGIFFKVWFWVGSKVLNNSTFTEQVFTSLAKKFIAWIDCAENGIPFYNQQWSIFTRILTYTSMVAGANRKINLMIIDQRSNFWGWPNGNQTMAGSSPSNVRWVSQRKPIENLHFGIFSS